MKREIAYPELGENAVLKTLRIEEVHINSPFDIKSAEELFPDLKEDLLFKIEKGRFRADVDTIKRLASLFLVDVSVFFSKRRFFRENINEEGLKYSIWSAVRGCKNERLRMLSSNYHVLSSRRQMMRFFYSLLKEEVLALDHSGLVDLLVRLNFIVIRIKKGEVFHIIPYDLCPILIFSDDNKNNAENVYEMLSAYFMTDEIILD